MQSLTQPADADALTRSRRRHRLTAQRALWSLSRTRVQHCGRRPVEGAGGVGVRVTGAPGARVAGFSGLQTCGSVWSCPACSARIMATRQQEIASALNRWEDQGGRAAFATFTIRHDRNDSLTDVWDAISKAWKAVTSGRDWAATVEEFGVEVEGRKRPVLPWVRVAEATHGKNGWHVHLHVLLFLPGTLTTDNIQDLYDSMWKRWARGAERAGFDGARKVNRVEVVHARKSMASYVSGQVYDGATSASFEVARGDLKSGRFGGRSPMQLLADVVSNRDPRDVALWHEWEQGSRGRRQMTWARGARDLFALGTEATDEEIAAEEIGTEADTIVWLDRLAWSKVCGAPGRRADILEAAERDGLPGVVAVLASFGVALGPPPS